MRREDSVPATSERQANFMKLVKARQHGHRVGGASVRRAAASMKSSDVEHMMHRGTTRLTGRKRGRT